MKEKKKISFVIPCYRSEKTIRSVVDEILDEMNAHKEFTYEIILVSDASPDGVYDEIVRLAEEKPHIKGAELTRNFGQHAALMAGYRMTCGDYIVSLDDDGEIPVQQTFRLLEKLFEGNDVAYAAYGKQTRGEFRKFGTKMNDYMANILLEKPKDLQITSFFAMKRIICDEIIRYCAPYPYVGGLILRTTKRVCSVPMALRPRKMGTSGYTFGKLLSLWMNGFTAFSVKPLRIATVIGFLCACIGFATGLFTVLRKIMNPSIQAGWSSLMATLLFLGGMIMIILGLIGEYLGRVYISLNAAPQYVIRQTVDGSEIKKEQSYT